MEQVCTASALAIGLKGQPNLRVAFVSSMANGTSVHKTIFRRKIILNLSFSTTFFIAMVPSMAGVLTKQIGCNFVNFPRHNRGKCITSKVLAENFRPTIA